MRLSKKEIIYSCFVFSIFCITWVPWTDEKVQWFWWADYFSHFFALVGIFILLAYVPVIRKMLAIVSRVIRKIRISDSQWAIGSAFVMLLLAGAGSTYIFKRVPGVDDTYSQYVQAKIFASGHWYSVSHPLRHFFDMVQYVNDGKFYSQYPPGHSLILAVGHLLGVPWLVNPTLAALSVIAAYFLTLEISNRYAARVATCLMLISPNIVFMASEYMNHMTALLCTLCFVLFYIRSHRYERIADAAIAGNALGFLFITRPQLAVPLAFPFVLHWIYTTCRARPAVFWRNGAVITFFFSMWGLFFCYYNYQTTGNPFITGYEKLGIGGWRPRLNLNYNSLYWDCIRAIIQLQTLHVHIFAWCTSSLILVWLFFQLRLNKTYCGLLIAGALSVAASLLLTPFNGNTFYARYLFEAASLCIVLTAICLARLPAWIKSTFLVNIPVSQLRILLYSAVAVLFITAIPYYIIDLVKLYMTHTSHEQNPGYYSRLLQVNKPALVFVNPDQQTTALLLFLILLTIMHLLLLHEI